MKNKFYLIILFVLCLLVLVSCGDNTHSSKPTVSPTKQPVEEAVDVYLKAANDLEKNDFIDYKMIYDMDIVSSDEETNLLMNTRVREMIDTARHMFLKVTLNYLLELLIPVCLLFISMVPIIRKWTIFHMLHILHIRSSVNICWIQMKHILMLMIL